MKVFCAAFMCLQFRFVIFRQKDFGTKMSVKLTPVDKTDLEIGQTADLCWRGFEQLLKEFFSKCCREKTSLSATVEPLQMALVRLVNFVLLPTCHFVNLPFCQIAIFSTSHFINLPFYQLGILSTWHFINLAFCWLGNFVNLPVFNLPICQLAI